ncbi:MAG: GGDEF and EAL domain-containing protein [Proteobacteria bacterium]|nr:GGDEF and EAL domain-containing protein [Pseudomonadota bacterium]
MHFAPLALVPVALRAVLLCAVAASLVQPLRAQRPEPPRPAPASAPAAQEVLLPAPQVQALVPQTVTRHALGEAVSVRLGQPLSGLTLNPGMGLRVGVVSSLTIDADGMMWVGGSAGIQRFDGRNLSEPLRHQQRVQPQASVREPEQPQQRGPDADALRDIEMLHAQGPWLYYTTQDGVFSYYRPTGLSRQIADDGSGWKDVEPEAGERPYRVRPQTQWCLAGPNRLLALSEAAPTRQLRDIDLASGAVRRVELPGVPSDSAIVITPLCNATYLIWVDHGLGKLRRYRLSDGALRDIELPPDMLPEPRARDAGWSLLAWSLDGQPLLGTSQGVARLDFAAARLVLDPALSQGLKGSRLTGYEREVWRLSTGTSRLWVSRRGSELFEVTPDGAVASHRLGWTQGITESGVRPIFGLVTTVYGTQEWIWLLQGESVVGYMRDTAPQIVSTTVHADDVGHFRADVWGVCDDATGQRWVINSLGQVGVHALRGPQRLHVLPDVVGVSQGRCMGGSLWALSQGGLVQLTRVADTVEVRRFRALDNLGTGTRVRMQQVDDERLLLLTPQRVRLLDVRKQEVLTQALPGYFKALMAPPLPRPGHPDQALVSGPGADTMTLVSLDMRRIWPLHLAAPSEPAALAPTRVPPMELAAWVDEERLIAVRHDGQSRVLWVSDTGQVARVEPLRLWPWWRGRVGYCALPGYGGSAILSTTQGLAQISLTAAQADYLTQREGVAWDDFNADACSLRGSRMLFGATMGWTEVDTTSQVNKDQLPVPMLLMVGEGREPMRAWAPGVDEVLAIDEQSGVLRLDIGLDRFSGRHDFDLYYRLKGVEPAWRRSADGGRVEFAGLRAGDYEIEYGFADDLGDPEAVRSVTLTVRAPWWRSSAMLILVALALAAVLAAWSVQQRRNLARLGASRQQLSLALEGSAGVLWDRCEGQVSCTDAPWLQLTANDLSGTVASFEERIHPEDLPRYKAAVQLCEAHLSEGLFIEYRLRHAKGHWVWVRDAGRAFARLGPDMPAPRLVGTLHEISHVKQIEEDLRRMASTDELTGLPNRRECNRFIDAAISRTLARGTSFCLLFLDLNQFKTINDSLGHSFGDALLRRVASDLTRALPRKGTLFRLGGDEFVVCLQECDVAQGERVAQTLLDALSGIRNINGVDVHVTGAFGIAACPQHADSRKELLQFADAAMYAAKASGPHSYMVFEMQDASRLVQRAHIEAALAQGLARRDFRVLYQPICDAQTRRTCRYEALLRWQHPQFTEEPLQRVIDILETSGLIRSVGAWVLDQALADHHTLCALNPDEPALGICVNVSVHQLRDAGFVQEVEAACQRHDVAPHALEIEVTESVLASTHECISHTLGRLRALGVGVSIDDFGVGYSSLSYLQSLPATTLKIDKSFIDGIDSNEVSRKLCMSLISMAHALGLRVVAEGVEREAQLRDLQSGGCEEVQGYLFARPMELAAMQQKASTAPAG